MKKAFLTFAALLLIISFGCRRNYNSDSPYKWTRVTPAIDSITASLELGFYDYIPMESLDSSIREVERLSLSAPDSLAVARALYWRGRWLRRYGNVDSALFTVRQGLAMVDSAEHPYDFFRLRAMVRQYSHAVGAEPYRDIDEEARFYNSIGDKPMTAAMYISLGATLFSIGDYDKSLSFMQKADKLNSELGFTKLVDKNKINIANIYQRKGERSKCVEILKSLTTVDDIKNDSAVCNLVWRNLYVNTDDIAYLHEAYKGVAGHDNRRDLQGLYQSLFSNYYAERGQFDSAAFFSALALRNLDYVANFDHKRRITEAYAATMQRQGKIDSALYFQKLSLQYTDSDYLEAQQSEVLRIANLREVSEVMRRERENVQNTRLYFTGAISLLIVIAAVIYLVLYRRQKRHEIAAQESKLEMEKERRSLLAMMLMLEEKDNLFGFLKTEIEKMRKENSIGVPEARHLESTIQTHLSADEDWKTFQQQFVQIYPSFAKQLLEAYPGLSETYVKLATYIFMGLDNNRIARLLAIRPESVKQARWRLRKMMNLDKDTPLDETIRALGASN